jgi:RNA polymerase sigma-70 factor (ECF subfamily)
MPAENSFRFPASLAAVVERCWRRAAAPVEWNLTRDQFQEALERSAGHRFSNRSAPDGAIAAYLNSLQLEDLALACACSAGNAAAWDHFITGYRPELYRAARAIAGEAGARELADSLYAELYGLRELEGRRRSHFDYFHGRSKLRTWLHAILAQRQVDEIRRTRRTEPLDDSAGNEGAALPAPNPPPDPEREKYLALLQAALTAALDALAPRDRLRLSYCYVEELTLAEIGKLLGEHEATVSRRLGRTRHEVRRRVEAALREGKKLSEAQLRLCFEYAREEWPFDLTQALSPDD